jgi:hypothetical protein
VSRVIILGCGPAGLAAAQAVVSSGHEAVIISNTDQPSRIYGCQYLHAPVPGYESVERVRVSYHLEGTPEEYRRKVYGNNWQGKVSPEDFIGSHDAWDIRRTYAAMWKNIITSGAAQLVVKRVVKGAIPFTSDLVVSTIPAQALCSNPEHKFLSHVIWANGSTTGISLRENQVICDGTPERSWYRISNVFGYRTTEWASKPHPSRRTAPVVKPLWTDCDCRPEVLRAGRYGAWEKKRLVHEVYPAVLKALE